MGGGSVNLSAEDAQRWVTIIGTLATVLVTVLTFFRSQNRRDVRAAVGASFTSTVEALSSDNDTTRMAGAVLLRRFFDRQTEQGTRGTPYVKEAIELIAGMLREELPPRIQKVLADGLRYARDLQRADLQHCNLENAYLGWKSDDDRGVNLTGADLYDAICTSASFKKACLHKTVFFHAVLQKASMIEADCTEADFREAESQGRQPHRGELRRGTDRWGRLRGREGHSTRGGGAARCRAEGAGGRGGADGRDDPDAQAVAPPGHPPMKRTVFVSEPSALSGEQRRTSGSWHQRLSGSRVRRPSAGPG